jgi:hypothetical protein
MDKLKNTVMREGNIEQQKFHIVMQEDHRAGQQEPEVGIKQADLSLKVVLLTRIIPYI